MKWKKRVNRSIAIALAFALVFTMNVPAAAWGVSGSDVESLGSSAASGQDGAPEADASSGIDAEGGSDSSDDTSAGSSVGEADADTSRNIQPGDDGIAGDEPAAHARASASQGDVSSIGPLRIFYTLDEGSEQEIGSRLNDGEKSVLDELNLDPSTFDVLHLRLAAAEGYSFERGSGSQLTDVSVSWQAITSDGLTLSYGIDLRSEGDFLACDIPSSLLRNVSNGEYERFAIPWTVDGAPPEVHGAAYGSYLGFNLFKTGEPAEFETDSIIGTYAAENGTAIVISESSDGRTIAIADEVTSGGSPAVSAFKDIAIACDSAGNPYRTEVNVNYSANAKFTLETSSDGTHTLTSLGNCTYRTAQGLDTGSISEGQVFAQTMVASVQGTKYPTLQKAIDAAQAGDTVTMLKDVDLTNEAALEVFGKENVTLDLGGFTLQRTKGVIRTSNSTLLIKNGTITGLYEKGDWTVAISVGRGTKLTIAADTTVIGPYGISVGKIADGEDESTAGAGTTIDIYGTVSGTSEPDALAWSGSGAITINGAVQSIAEYAKIHVHEGARLVGMHGTDPNDVNGADAPAIYAAGYGEWTIDDGAEIVGDEALSIKSGKFAIKGGTFTANGVYCDPATSFNNGSEATGAAISVTKSKGYVGWVHIEITGGTFTSENGYALYESDTKGSEGSPFQSASTLRVKGGAFQGAAGALYVKHNSAFVEGGTFSSDVSEYLNADYIVKESNGQFVVEADQVATVTKPDGSTQQYTSLITAFGKAKDGDTVTLLKDVPAKKTLYTIKTSITFDLNGHRLDSTKYYTLMTDKYGATINVKVMNGIIANSYDGTESYNLGMAVLARQGGNLTLENVVLEATNIGDGLQGFGMRIGEGNNSSNPTVTVLGENTHIVGKTSGVGVIGSNNASRPTLVVEDGVIEGGSFGIAGNGTDDGTSIDIKGGTVRSTGADGCAIYHPQNGDLIISGGTLTGPNGVQFCGEGKLSIEGGSIEATAAAIDAPNMEGSSASILDGAALSLVSRSGGYGAAGTSEVNISGGTLTSANNAAIQEYTAEGVETLVKSLSITQAEGETLTVSGAAGKPAVSFAALTADAAKVITGGTFSSDVKDYCAPGYTTQAQAEGTMFDVVDDYEAAIGDTRYVTLQDALKGAQNGDTVSLLKDVSTNYVFVYHSGTIDLGGHTLTGTNASFCVLYQHGTYSSSNIPLKIQNGTINSVKGPFLDSGEIIYDNLNIIAGSPDQSSEARATYIDKAAHLIVKENCTLSVSGAGAGYGVVLHGDDIVVDLYGSIHIDVKDGSAISGNGQYTGTTINIHPGAVADGGETGFGIYHPQDGKLVISGGTVAGATGLEMRAGSLDVSGDAVITGTMKPTEVKPNGSGATTAGAGIAVAQHETELPIIITISGGTISGYSAFYESNPQGNTDSLEKISFSITGGTFNAINEGTLAVYSENKKDFITGGTFNAELDTAYYDENIYVQNAQDAVDAPGAVVPRAFAIDYDLAGGAFADGVQAPASYTYFSDDIVLPQPTRTGYDFAGWTGADLTAPTVQVPIAKGSTGDRAYTATWTARTDASYTVHYYLKGTSSVKVAEDKVVSGRTFGEAYQESAPKIDGYAVSGSDSQTVTVDAYNKELAFYYDAVATVPDANVIVQVEQPAADEFAAPDQTVAAAAAAGVAAVQGAVSGETPAGMSPEEAQAVRELIEGANGADVTVVVSLKAEVKDEGAVDLDDKGAIESEADDGEAVALYFELSVEMTVKVDGGGEEKVLLDEVDEPLLFELKVNSDDIAGKSVRIAHVHEGAAETIVPESVDYKQGIVRFHASAFSTYALLASSTVTVTFESNGGSAVTSQTVTFGGRATKPADPTRAGYTFGGWFSDEGLTSAYDFNAAVERPITLYAKWAAAGPDTPDDPNNPIGSDGSGNPPADANSGGDQDPAKRPSASKTPNAYGSSASTGDPLGALVGGAVALAAAAALVLAAVAVHRRRRHGRQ